MHFTSGILKKTDPLREDLLSCECNSQCSCDQSSCSSCSMDEPEQVPAIASRIPVPDDQCVQIVGMPSPTLESTKYNRVMWQSPTTSISTEQYIIDTHDSNSDSAIDLPKGDSAPTVLTDSLFTVHKSKQPLTDSYSAYLQPVVPTDKSCLAQNNDLNIETNRSAAVNSFSLADSETLPTSPIYSSSHIEPIHTAATESEVTPLDTSSTSTSHRDDESTATFSTFSIRPLNGPMRTFQPTATPTSNHQKQLNLLDVIEPLLSSSNT